MNPIRIGLGVSLAVLIAAPARAQEQGAPPAKQTAASAAQTDQQPPPASASNPVRVQVGGRVEAAKLIHMVQPVYPKEVQALHISGTVRLRGLIAKDGSVQQIEYVSGPVELEQAAIDAVKQWKYEPTTLAGKPVAVNTTIDVVFSLDKLPPPPPEMPNDSNTAASAPVATLMGGLELKKTPPPAPAQPPMRIRVGASVQGANLIHRVEPIYPPEVKAVGISGTVILHIMVATDGAVEQVEFVSGPQELMAAAMSAVKQWR